MAISHLYPTQRPALDLNFARQKRLDSRVTFTRGSTATYVGSDGLIKTAASGEARFDHDPVTGESLGLLVEESRTNLMSHSTAPNTSNNYRIYGTPTYNNHTAPDGTLTATKIVGTGSAKAGFDVYPNDYGSNQNSVQTFSVFVKNIDATEIYLALTTQGNGLRYNFSTNTTTLVGSGTTGTVQEYPNGWYKVSTTLTKANQYWYWQAMLDNFQNTANSVYFWGVQLENGGFPTSYISTSGSTVTRSADVASMTGTNFSSWYNQSEGSIFTVARIGDLSTANQTIASAEETASTVQFNSLGYRVGGGGSGYIGAWSYNSTGQAFFNINAGITSNTEFKAIHSYKTDDYAASVNGSVPVTDTLGNASTTIDRLRIGAGVYGSVVTGHISRLTYYPTRLSDDQLQALTL